MQTFFSDKLSIHSETLVVHLIPMHYTVASDVIHSSLYVTTSSLVSPLQCIPRITAIEHEFYIPCPSIAFIMSLSAAIQLVKIYVHVT
jgi:hypothetical protein